MPFFYLTKSGLQWKYVGIENITMKTNTFLILSFLCIISGCKKPNINPMPLPTSNNSADKKEITYLALGDSYTIGERVFRNETYPYLLGKELENKGIVISETKVIAQTGWTTKDLQSAIPLAGLNNKEFNMVSLLIGVNNQYQGKELNEYQRDFIDLLNTAISLAGNNRKKVFVISIPDYGFTPFGADRKEAISAEINSFNIINKQVSDSLGILYFDITPISRKGFVDLSLISKDGLHPSGKMYQEWVELILPGVINLIKI